MSSFLTGLMSVGKKIGGAAKSWGEGTKIGRDIDAARPTKKMGPSAPTNSSDSLSSGE